jgi:hypothetical protein
VLQVLVGPDENDGKGPWYFSLNNRRLWVFKQCREEGLLPDNTIAVRVRQPKSLGEVERYTVENCAVEAKFLREKKPQADRDCPDKVSVCRSDDDASTSLDQTRHGT